MSLKTFHIITYGCQMNQYDSNVIATRLESMGLKKTEVPEDAEFVLINTCSVREHAEVRAEGRLRSLSGGIGNIKKLGVIGCMAQRKGQKLLDSIKGLDFAISPDHIESIFDIVSNKISHGAFLGNSEYTGKGNYSSNDGKISAFVGINRGCDNFCKYCIVPYVRGRLRSRNDNDIIHEVENLVSKGAYEITLLGQNVNAYHYKDIGFAKLLEKVNAINGVKRIRFTTNHPKDLTSDIIDAMASLDKVAPSIHLPVQSGSTRVLNAMGRGYSRERYLDIIAELKDKIDNIAIASDILVGYPGETLEDYQETVSLIDEVDYAGLFCFKYSVRPGTAAARLDDDVPEKEKLRRIDEVINIGQEKAKKFSKAQIGRVVQVMVEGISAKNPDKLRGYAGSSRVVEFTSNQQLNPGDFIPVKIDSSTSWTLYGKHQED